MLKEEMRSVGFVGLGNMGWPMAARLIGAGYQLTVLDSDRTKVDDFTRDVGGKGADGPLNLAAGCDAVITMLPNSQIVKSVLEGPGGLMQGLKKGAVLIEMSSGAPDVTVELTESLKNSGVHLADAPVSGGVAKAVTGELSIMLGSTASLRKRPPETLRA